MRQVRTLGGVGLPDEAAAQGTTGGAVSPYVGLVHERSYGDTADLAGANTEGWFAWWTPVSASDRPRTGH